MTCYRYTNFGISSCLFRFMDPYLIRLAWPTSFSDWGRILLFHKLCVWNNVWHRLEILAPNLATIVCSQAIDPKSPSNSILYLPFDYRWEWNNTINLVSWYKTPTYYSFIRSRSRKYVITQFNGIYRELKKWIADCLLKLRDQDAILETMRNFDGTRAIRYHSSDVDPKYLFSNLHIPLNYTVTRISNKENITKSFKYTNILCWLNLFRHRINDLFF